MFDSVGWGELLVLVVAGLFILGPERLPSAAAWLGRSLRQLKEYAGGARQQLRDELGPEFDELRKPLADLREPLSELREFRDLNPRRMFTRQLFDDDPVKPNGFPTGGLGAAAVGDTTAGMRQVRPLDPGECPPVDPDAT